MRDVDNRRTGALVESRKLVFHRSTQMHIKIGKRFVKQDQRRGCYQTAGQSHTLPLTTRKIGRAAITKTVKIDQRQRLANTVLTLGFGNLCHPQTIADILGDRHMRPERIILEDDTDLPLFRWHVTVNMGNAAVSNMDFAAVNVFKTCNHPQKRCLAAAGWSENGNKLAVLHIKRHFRQGLKFIEGLGNRSDFQSRHGSTRLEDAAQTDLLQASA